MKEGFIEWRNRNNSRNNNRNNNKNNNISAITNRPDSYREPARMENMVTGIVPPELSKQLR